MALTKIKGSNIEDGAVSVSKGGTGLSALGAADKVLKFNSAGNAL